MQRADLIDNRPILRLANKEDFNRVPADMRAEILKELNISNWESRYFQIQLIREDEHYGSHYMRRVSAINDGAQFLLDSMPEETISADKKTVLKNTINSISSHCTQHLAELRSTEIADYQNSLYNYLNCITIMLSTMLDIEHKKLTGLLDRSEQFALMSRQRPAVCTITNLFHSENEFAALIDTPLNPFNDDIKAQLANIKHKTGETHLWFAALSNEEKKLLEHFLDHHVVSEFGNEINAVSSKLRLIPVPSNYGKHTIITRIQTEMGDAVVTTHASEIRSSHIASRDVPKGKTGTRSMHALNNLTREIEDAIEAEIMKRMQSRQINQDEIVVPILYQTLITPLKDPDTTLDKDKAIAVAAIEYYLQNRPRNPGEPNLSFVLITTNHPLNYGKYLAPLLSSETNEGIRTLLYFARKNLSGSGSDMRLRMQACDILERITQEYTTFLDPYRELYFSTLEQIIVGLQGGISIGSCVSGKDRKAVEIIHTDAMKIYYSKYHSLPPLYAASAADNDAMQRFADIFAEIYCTKHQPALADQNAPGSFGTKTPGMYLPAHLQAAVRTWYENHAEDSIYAAAAAKDTLNESDILASNNDLKHIHKIKMPGDSVDLSWNSLALHINEYQTIEDLITKATQAIQHYLPSRSARAGFFSRLSGSEAGEHRAIAYQAILSSIMHHDTPQKTLVMYALMTTKGGTNLKEDLSKAMGFSSVENACEVLSTNMHKTARLSGIASPDIIETLAIDIQTTIAGIKSMNDIPACVDSIVSSLAALNPAPSPRSPSPGPHSDSE